MRELYVKWKGRAHVHCAWVPEAAVMAAARRAPQLLRRVKAFRQRQDDSVRVPHSPATVAGSAAACGHRRQGGEAA